MSYIITTIKIIAILQTRVKQEKLFLGTFHLGDDTGKSIFGKYTLDEANRHLNADF